MIQIDHVADFNRRYPGETVTFFSRIRPTKKLTGLTFRLTVPPELNYLFDQPPQQYEAVGPRLEVGKKSRFLTWTLNDSFAAGTILQFETKFKVLKEWHDETFQVESRAEVFSPSLKKKDSQTSEIYSESVLLLVPVKGSYLNHLPNFYYQDDFMGRFLMLFESFWGNIESQVDHIHYYFDPKLTPPEFVDWIAEWFELAIDEDWDIEKRRRMLKNAMYLYRKRGTKDALNLYMDIYGDVQTEIIEHRGVNFSIGPDARMGLNLSLGTSNQPHTFTMKVKVPAIDTGDPEEDARLEIERMRTLEKIINQEKPAHTEYNFIFETIGTSPS